jgi:Tol biopolymer transport system component
VVALFAMSAMPASAVVEGTVRASIDTLGGQFPGPSGSAFSAPALTPDGAGVAFESTGQGAKFDANGASDVYFRQVTLEETELVSVTSEGVTGNNRSGWASINGDGRFIAFESMASDLVEGDGNNTLDVFVRDRQSGTTERASVSSEGGDANGASGGPSISLSGRTVAFCSRASNLVAGAATGPALAYVRDLDADTTSAIAPDGATGGEGCARVALSGDGRFLAFSHQAAPGALTEVYRHDRETGETVALTSGDGSSGRNALAISENGGVVVFDSAASNLIDGDGNEFSDVFLWSAEDGTTTRVSVKADGTEGNAESGTGGAAISSNGRYVTFASTASNLVAGDGNRSADIFRIDRERGELALASVGANNLIGNATSYSPDVSDDGVDVAFVSMATNLISGDRNRHADVYIRGAYFSTDGGGEEAPPEDNSALPGGVAPGTSSGEGGADEFWMLIAAVVAGLALVLVASWFALGRRARD